VKLTIAFLVVGGLFLAGGFLWRSEWIDFLRRPAEEVASAPEPAPPPPVAVKKPAPVRKIQPAVVEEPPTPVVAAVDPAPKVEAAPPPEPRPFPTIDQVTVGVPQAKVVEEYGVPTISTLTSHGGHILESYVYAKDKGRSETLIRLEDGRVASATSATIPPPPSGIEVPRYGH
jgi:hypothetical protein